MSLFLSIFWPPMLVLSLHILRVLIFPEAYSVDMLAHFLGGASIALVAWKLIRALTERRFLPAFPRWLSRFMCIATTELVGVLWEFWEFYIQNRFMYMGITLEDTMSDLLLDLCGAVVITSVLVCTRRDRHR